MSNFIRFVFFLTISGLVLTSCEKKPDCEVNKTGTITISNSSSNPYDIYINGIHKVQLKGNGISSEITISEGNDRELYARQVSGYILYPTERTEYFNVVRCSDYSWQIP